MSWRCFSSQRNLTFLFHLTAVCQETLYSSKPLSTYVTDVQKLIGNSSDKTEKVMASKVVFRLQLTHIIFLSIARNRPRHGPEGCKHTQYSQRLGCTKPWESHKINERLVGFSQQLETEQIISGGYSLAALLAVADTAVCQSHTTWEVHS